MPFQSEKQRRFMWANHPKIAQRWADEQKHKDKLTSAARKKLKKRRHS
jgi:hypothetical protein